MAEQHGQVSDERLDAEREARRRLALARIRQWPDPVLRMRAHDVEEFDDDLRQLVTQMQALMEDANGVGLAANQVGVLRRVVVFRVEEGEEPVAAVNPRIVDPSGERVSEDEGKTWPVVRAIEPEELGARVVQHELDHLDGVLILDRTTPEARREAMATLRPQPVLG